MFATKQFNVPRSTLKRRHKDQNKSAKGSLQTLGRYNTVFTSEMESELVRYIIQMEEMMFR